MMEDDTKSEKEEEGKDNGGHNNNKDGQSDESTEGLRDVNDPDISMPDMAGN